MDLYEYQGKELFRRYGIPISEGRLATTPAEARAAAEELGAQVVVKAQVLTGGRGKAGGVKLADAVQSPTLQEQELLVTDGPIPMIPGTLDAKDLAQVKHFALESEEGTLGLMPLLPAPTARFTGEGGFEPVEEFLWSPAADEQLNERLGKLLGGP